MTYRLAIRVHPAASRTHVGGRRGDALLVAVTAPAIDNRANTMACHALAAAFNLRPRQVTIARGHHSRNKLADLDLDPTQAETILATLLSL